jgi:hypothetical protein
MTAKRRATIGALALSLVFPPFACADEMKIGSWLFQQVNGTSSSEVNWELTAKHPGDGAPDPPADFKIECRGKVYSFYLTIWGDSGTSLQSLPLNVTIDGKEHFTLSIERKGEIAAPFKAMLPSDVLAAFGRATHNITFAYSGHLPIGFDVLGTGEAVKMLQTTCNATPPTARQVVSPH